MHGNEVTMSGNTWDTFRLQRSLKKMCLRMAADLPCAIQEGEQSLPSGSQSFTITGLRAIGWQPYKVMRLVHQKGWSKG